MASLNSRSGVRYAAGLQPFCTQIVLAVHLRLATLWQSLIMSMCHMCTDPRLVSLPLLPLWHEPLPKSAWFQYVYRLPKPTFFYMIFGGFSMFIDFRNLLFYDLVWFQYVYILPKPTFLMIFGGFSMFIDLIILTVVF